MIASLIAALVICAVHVLTHRLRFLEGVPRSRWLSLSGGASVAYVILHLLPELAEHQEVLSEASWTSGIHHAVYLLTLAGLLTFYGFERASRMHVSRQQMSQSKGTGSDGGHEQAPDYASKSEEKDDGGDNARRVYRLHLVLFSIYSLIVGYALASESYEMRELVLFAVAMALHFVVVDKALDETFEAGWRRVGRWTMAASVLAGWSTALLLDIPHGALASVDAFLGGAVILNVLKEELPEERESKLGAFVVGAAGYALLLVWL